jgi:hypothetical protein
MLYATLLAPFVALPALLLMDRVERWAVGPRRGQASASARPSPTARAAQSPLRV